MGAYPTQHVPTRMEVIGEVQEYVKRELVEISNAETVLREQGRNTIELVAEKNALTRLLKFLSNLKLQGRA